MYGVGGERTLIEYEVPWLPVTRVRPGARRQRRVHPVPARDLRAHDGGRCTSHTGWGLKSTHRRGRCCSSCSRTSKRCGNTGLGDLGVARDCPGTTRTRRSRPGTRSRAPCRWYANSVTRAGRALGRGRATDPQRGLRGSFNTRLNAFVQSYDDDQLDASVLLLPLIDFLPGDDERVVGTVRALEQHLLVDGFLYRTTNDPENRDAPEGPDEGAFPRLQFLAGREYVLQGRLDDARRSSNGCSASPTTSACSPKNTTRRRGARRQLPADVLARGPHQRREAPARCRCGGRPAHSGQSGR